MAGEEKENIWQDEDELRRMMIEAEENEFWQVEPADESAEEAGQPPLSAAAFRLRAWMSSTAPDAEGESIQDGE